MSTITINYTANYLGDHRICYRNTGALTYCCLLDTVTALGPQTFVIDFSIAPDFCFGLPEEVTPPLVSDCGPVEYDGYIQPICEIFGSLNNRTPFTASFTTVPTCLQYNIGCLEAGVKEINIQNPGSTYDVIPGYVISGAGGAALDIHMASYTGGASVFFGGTGVPPYSDGDILTVVGGTGTAVQLQVNVGGQVGGVIQPGGVTVIAIGDYTVLPVNPVSVIGGTGLGATFDIEYSVLSATAPVIFGTYIAIPTIIFDPPAGAGNTTLGTVVMFPCFSVIVPPTCGIILDNGIPNPGKTIQITFLESAQFCTTLGTPVVPLDYSVGIDPFNTTCCGCVILTASAIKGAVLDFWYTDADTHDFIYLDPPGGFPGPGPIVTAVNAIPGSWGSSSSGLDNVNIINIACP